MLRLWGKTLLDYSWKRSLMGHYDNFWKLTGQSLEYTFKKLQIVLPESQKQELTTYWLTLSPFKEIETQLRRMAKKYKLAVFSNATPKMLRSGLKNAGLSKFFKTIISAHKCKMYKPHPAVYKFANEKLEVPASRVLYVAGSSLDAIGARGYGFTSVWINRGNRDHVDLVDKEPNYIFSDLTELWTFLQK